MSAENPNLLRQDIHTNFDASTIGGGSFQDRIVALEDTYPLDTSQGMYTYVIQELNRKLDKFGFADQIVLPIDAGFRPLPSSFPSFFTPGETFWTWSDVGRDASTSISVDLDLEIINASTDVYWNGAVDEEDTYPAGSRNTNRGTWTGAGVFDNPKTRKISISAPANVQTLQVDRVNNARLGGSLDLTGFTALRNFFCDRQNLTFLNVDTANNTLYKTIRADFNNITGTLPTINTLSNLRTFAVTFSNYSGVANQPPNSIHNYDVADNHLSGNLPDFTNCSQLRGLFVHNNEFTGNCPDITANPQLVDCQLDRNNFVGQMPEISSCPNMLFFDTAGNDLTGDIKVISGNTALKQMWCNENKYTGSIPHLQFNTNLFEFQCARNNLTGWNGTGVAPSLKKFWANTNDLSQGTMDNLIKAFDAAGATNGVLYIGGGNNASPSSSSNSHVASLTGKGWNVFLP